MKTIQPKRRKHSCEQVWSGTPDAIFPLLCPVREVDWVPGWEPKLVVSKSGFMELNCLFVEPDTPSDAIWIVTRYEKNQFVEMYRVLPSVTVSQFSIRLNEKNEEESNARISYEHTALGDRGEKIIDEFTEASFLEFMSHFKGAINHYLTTGEKISE